VATAFARERAWGLKPTVSMRPEAFGALAYDFDTRRLSFLKHPLLVAVVEGLGAHATAEAACAAAGVTDAQRPAILRALGHLAEREVIVERAA
jgi:putative mycofactocin binding protein MftB